MFNTLLFQVQFSDKNYLGKIKFHLINYGCVEYSFTSSCSSTSLNDILTNYIKNYADLLKKNDSEEYQIKSLLKDDCQIMLSPDIRYDLEIDESKSWALILNTEFEGEKFIELKNKSEKNHKNVTEKSKYFTLEDISIDYDPDEPEYALGNKEEMEEIYSKEFQEKKLLDANKKIQLLCFIIKKYKHNYSELFDYLKCKLLTQYCRAFKYTNENFRRLKYNFVVTSVDIRFFGDSSYEKTIQFRSQSGEITGRGEISKVECNYDDWNEYRSAYFEKLYSDDKSIANELVEYLYKKYF